jgi:multisubunit Na+/H+ antiporter MnhF subunit
MIDVTITICLVILGAAALLSLWRIIVGPGVLDRVIAYDSAAICVIGMMVLLSIKWKTDLLVEVIMIFSLLGFMGTIAIVCYLNAAIPRQRAASKSWRERRKKMKGDASKDSANSEEEGMV